MITPGAACDVEGCPQTAKPKTNHITFMCFNRDDPISLHLHLAETCSHRHDNGSDV